ncbi:hypothetical protein S40293_07865 [Stachybotrys chartarum IBT 40293]|nr:hypothetical protein S40293_07865 [Stachybotrys chartarum IBT 40293]
MDKEEAREYLSSLLNHTLRVVVTDGRMFSGSFKCTDPDKNVILAHAYEYRQPTAEKKAEGVQEAASTSQATVTLDMTSRYLGLIVIPGEHIVKMEVERFASQLKSGV